MGMFDIFANWGMQNPDERKKSLEEIARGSQYGTGLQNKSDFKDSSSLVSRYNLRDRQNPNVVPMQKKQSIYPDAITTGGQGTQQGDIGFLQRLSNLAGVDMDKAAAMWKDKGGFEGLMSNPAFTMGLAFMQAGANGKTLGQDALNNVVKAAGISAEFKDRIAARKQAPIQATAGDIAEVKDLLQTMKIDEPNMWEKAFGWIKGDNVTAKYDEAAEQIAVEYQKEIAILQKNNKSGKPLVIDTPLKKRIIKKVLKSGKIKHKKGWFGPVTKGTIQGTSEDPFKARGGPVKANKAYIVGEEGPEIMIAKSSGKVLSNDDSQIFAMLLAANPQLQKVSKARAEKIMRSRFPEYFE
tara:strand:- start:2512 stop:3570 length:1059 start_codon:yes stop_codon:yes gene_type:complete